MQGQHSQPTGPHGSQQLQAANHYQAYQHSSSQPGQLHHHQAQQLQQLPPSQGNQSSTNYPAPFYNNMQQNVGRSGHQQQSAISSPPQHLQQPSNYMMPHGQPQQQLYPAPQVHQGNPQRSARSDKNSQQQLYAGAQGGPSAPQQQPMGGHMPPQMVNLVYGPGGHLVGGMQQEPVQQYIGYENQPSDRNVILTNRSNTANTVNTHVSCSQHRTARSQGTACSQSQSQPQQNQSHSSHHKKSKKKRLPPPKVRIQQPNFNNMGERNGAGENSISYSDQQEEMSEVELRQQREQQSSFMMHQGSPEYAGIGAHQQPYHGGGANVGQAHNPSGSRGANVASGVNHDSYVNDSSVLYAQNSNSQAQYQGQSSRANSYRNQGNDVAGVGPSGYGNLHPSSGNMAPPMQPLGFVGPPAPIHEDEKADDGDPFMDTEKRDLECMMEWNFADSTDNSMDGRRPSQLDEMRPSGPQQSNRNNNRLYQQTSDYIAQPNQQLPSAPNPHLSSHQNEDNSRYTELSSIRPDSVNEAPPMMGQNQFAGHPQHGYAMRGPGGGPTNQRHPQLPPAGPRQAVYGNDYGQNDYQVPQKQQRRDHDSLLTRVQAVENQTKAELQQIHNDTQGTQGGELEPELSLSQLAEQDPIKKMLNGESIIEEDPHEDYASGIGECLDCIRESGNDMKKKRKKHKKNSGRPCKHQRHGQPANDDQAANMFFAADPPQDLRVDPNQPPQKRGMDGGRQQHGQHLLVNNFVPPQSQDQEPNRLNDDRASKSYTSRSNEDDEDDEGSRNSYDESSSCSSDESGEYIFHDDPSAEQDEAGAKNAANGLGMGGPYYSGGQNNLIGQQISGNAHSFNRNAMGRNGQPGGFYGPNGELVQQSHSRESHLLPIQFAKEHIIKIEEDMKKMHERHVKLMREMDQNYKLIEEETQEYYIEFLRKWKEVAKQRILQYRKNTESLSQEKERIEKEKNAEIESLVMQRNKLLKEKKEILEQNNKSIMDRDNEMEDQRVQFEQKLKKHEQVKDQEILALQNEKKKLDLQITGMEARYRAETEQLKLQNEQLNAQVDELQAQEESHTEDVENLRAQLENLKESEQALKEQTEKLKAEVGLKESLLKSSAEQLEQRSREQEDQQSKVQQRSSRIAELEAQVEQLRVQVAELTALNTQSSIKSVASAVQGGAVNQDQGQISSSHVVQQYNTERTQEQEVKSLQPAPANPALIQRGKQAAVRIRNPTGDREQTSGSQPPQSSNQQLQQSILAQINQQNLKSSLKIKPVRGHGGKDLVLKPASIIQNQSFNSVASVGSAASALAGGVGSAANSRTRQTPVLMPPMSEQDYRSKQSNIEKMYQPKLDEVNQLIKHFSLRIACFEQQHQRGEIGHGAEEQIEFDRRVKERLEREESNYKSEMSEEAARLKRIYEQSQRAQIQQKNIQQNRNSSLQFSKRNDLNSSNLEGSEPLLLNKNPSKIQASLRIKKAQQQNKLAEHPYSNNGQPPQDHAVNTETASSSKSNPPVQPETLTTSSIKIIAQGQVHAGSSLQQTTSSIQNRQLLPVASANAVAPTLNINSAREPAVCQSMRVHPLGDEQVLSQQTLRSVQKELQKRIADLTKEAESLRNKNLDLEKEKESQEAKQAELEAELKEIKSSLMDMSVLNSQLQEKSRVENNTTVEGLQKEVEELKVARRNCKQECTKKLTYAKTQMDQLKKITYGLRDEKTQFKASIKEQEAVLEKLTQQNEEICQQLQHERQELVAAKAQRDGLVEEHERLWLRYQAETIHRQRLHNTIEDMKGKIRVYCRVRPMNDNEKKMSCIDAVSVSDRFTLRIRVKKDQQLYKHDHGSGGAGQLAQYQHKEFQFDSCFDATANQEMIFQDTKMLIQSAIDGYNVCIFAYGQTGSGKTYTVTGSADNPGIVPRSFQEMFAVKERLEKDNHFTVSFSCYMVELYLDRLIDLLAPDSAKQPASHSSAEQLKIREDPQTGMIYIQNVNHRQLNSDKEAIDVFNLGLKSRKVGATGMNDHSSRSHLVFSVVIEARNNNNGDIQSGKISFVDLAGSERASKSNPGFNYERQRESNAINLSLKYLGDVISCLSNEELPKTHIPYLNNKLTHLMKDSLGGRAKTLMFVNISPADWNAQESLNSLQFGQRVKMVQNDVSRNIETDTTKRLKAEIVELKRRLGE